MLRSVNWAALVQHAGFNVNVTAVLAHLCSQCAPDVRCVGGYRDRGPFICPKLNNHVHSLHTCAFHFTANEGRLRCNDLALLANRKHRSGRAQLPDNNWRWPACRAYQLLRAAQIDGSPHRHQHNSGASVCRCLARSPCAELRTGAPSGTSRWRGAQKLADPEPDF